MKTLTTLEIIIIIVILVVTALFILSWLGIGSNPLEWFRKQSVKTTFCSEIIERTNCQLVEVTSVDELGISRDDLSTKIKNRDIGVRDGDSYANFIDICKYLGQTDFKSCLVKLCGCKIR